MAYRHRVVSGLAELLDKYGGGGKDPIMRGLWIAIKWEIPHILQQLDDSEEAIALIESKLREVLDIPPVEKYPEVVAEAQAPIPIEKIKEAVKKAPPKRKRRTTDELVEAMEEPVAEVEATIEPAEE